MMKHQPPLGVSWSPDFESASEMRGVMWHDPPKLATAYERLREIALRPGWRVERDENGEAVRLAWFAGAR